MRVLIVGATLLGRELNMELERAGHEVHQIERPPLGETALSEAIDGCDAIVTVTDDDATNAVVALAARRRFRVPLATAVIANTGRAEALNGLGIKVMCPTVRTARELHLELVRSDVETELIIGGHVAMCRAEIPARLAGRRLAEVERKGQIIPVAVERDGGVLLAAGELRLRERDVLHVFVDDPERMRELMRP